MHEITQWFNPYTYWDILLAFYHDWMIYFGYSAGYQTPNLLEHISCPKNPYFSDLSDLNVEMGFHGNAIANATLASYERTALQYGSFLSGHPELEKRSNPLENLKSLSIRDQKRDVFLLVHPDKYVNQQDKKTAEKVTMLKTGMLEEIEKRIEESGQAGLKIQQTQKVRELLDLAKLAGEIWPLVCQEVNMPIPSTRKLEWPFSVISKQLSTQAKIHLLTFLFKKGISINSVNAKGNTLLMEAIEKGEDEALLTFLLEREPDLSVMSRTRDSALLLGVKRHLSLGIVERLVSPKTINAIHGAHTPLGLAIEKGNLALAKRLLKLGAEPKNAATHQQRPFYLFTKNPQCLDDELIEILLDKGVNLKYEEYQAGLSVIATAIQEALSLKTVVRLIQSGANPRAHSSKGTPVLMMALNTPKYQPAVLELLKAGADYLAIDKASEDSFIDRLVQLATTQKVEETFYFQVFQNLLEQGRNHHFTLKNGDNLLNIMIRLKCPVELIQQAIKLGIDINRQGSDSETPFLEFLRSYGFKHEAVIDEFLTRGVDVELRSRDKDIIELLVDELEKVGKKKAWGVMNYVSSTTSQANLDASLETIQIILTKLKHQPLIEKKYGQLILKAIDLSLGASFVHELIYSNKQINYQNEHGLTIPLALLKGQYPEETIDFALKGFEAKLRPGFSQSFLTTLLPFYDMENPIYSEQLLERVIDISGVLPTEKNEMTHLVEMMIKGGLSENLILKVIRQSPKGTFETSKNIFASMTDVTKQKWLYAVANRYFEAKESWGFSKKSLNEVEQAHFKTLLAMLLQENTFLNIRLFNGQLLPDVLITYELTELLPDTAWSNHPYWDAPDKDGNTLLLKSIKNGANESFIEKLIKLGINIDAKDKDGNSALFWLMSKGYSEKLINHFLHQVTSFGVKERLYYYRKQLLGGLGGLVGLAVFHALLRRKADGWQPIHYAAKYNGEQNLKRFLENGAAINSLTRSGETPLAIAIRYNNQSAINFLVKEGALLDTQLKAKWSPHQGWTSWDFANHYQNETAMNYIQGLEQPKVSQEEVNLVNTLLPAFKQSLKNPSIDLKTVEEFAVEAPADSVKCTR